MIGEALVARFYVLLEDATPCVRCVEQPAVYAVEVAVMDPGSAGFDEERYRLCVPCSVGMLEFLRERGRLVREGA